MLRSTSFIKSSVCSHTYLTVHCAFWQPPHAGVGLFLCKDVKVLLLKMLLNSYRTHLLDINWWVEQVSKRRAVSRLRAAFQSLIWNVTEGTAGGRNQPLVNPRGKDRQTDMPWGAVLALLAPLIEGEWLSTSDLTLSPPESPNKSSSTATKTWSDTAGLPK